MKYQAKTTLKKKDTDGGVPSSILDQYIRSELAQQLFNQLKPHLSVHRHEPFGESQAPMHLSSVDFTTELVMLNADQWKQLKQWLAALHVWLTPTQQIALRELINDIERS